MKKSIKKMALVMAVILALSAILAACTFYEDTGSEADTKKTIYNANVLQKNQPTPTDISYSLERYNLLRRAYWVNGMREKAVALPCEITKPVGYIVLFAGNAAVGSFTVDGKVTSLNSYLTPDSEYYEYSSGSSSIKNDWLADVDGSYGTNDNGIFFFTTDGKYIEWTGEYLYSDIPMQVESPVVQYEVAK